MMMHVPEVLTAEAFEASGGREVVLGLLGGALAFYLGDRMLDSRGGADRKMSGGQQAGSAAQGLVLGALLDVAASAMGRLTQVVFM